MNDLHPTIKFKYEFEENGQLPFLDVLVGKKADNFLEFSVYRKATHSNSYIHFFSSHDSSVKYSTISSMFLRAYRVCNPQFLDEEINVIYKIFTNLFYPKWFIDKAHRKSRKTYFKTNSVQEDSDYKRCIVFPFNQNLKFLNNVLKESNYKLAFNNPGTIGKTLINNKPKQTIEAGVYKIPCKDINCGKSYYGETGRSMDVRIKEHKNDIRTGNNQNALFNHMESTAHCIDFENKELFFQSENYIERRIVESCLIDSKSNYNMSAGQFKINKILNKIILFDIEKKRTRIVQ